MSEFEVGQVTDAVDFDGLRQARALERIADALDQLNTKLEQIAQIYVRLHG